MPTDIIKGLATRCSTNAQLRCKLFVDLRGSPPETVTESVYPILPDSAPVISVGYDAIRAKIPPFTPSTGVQIPLGTPFEGTTKNTVVYFISVFFAFLGIFGSPKSRLVCLHLRVLWVYLWVPSIGCQTNTHMRNTL